MGYNNQTKGNTKSNAGSQGQAAGFINISLPNGRGGKRKVGSIFLFDDKVDHRQLREWLEADPANVAKFVSQMIVEYNPNIPDEDKLFALPE